MSMPRRSKSRMAASVLQAGPMVQMILARRVARFVGIDSSTDLFLLTLTPRQDSQSDVAALASWVARHRNIRDPSPSLTALRRMTFTLFQRRHQAFTELIAVSSFPNIARGNSSAL